MRGFAIFLVVLGHVLNIGMNNYDETALLHRIIYSFHMPLFFFISGLVSYKSVEVWSGTFLLGYIKRKFFQLLVPTYLFFIIATTINHDDVIDSFCKAGVARYWFGQALFQMLLVYGLISWLSRRFFPKLFLPILLLLCVLRGICLFVDEEPLFYRIFVLRDTFLNVPFFVFGILASIYKGHYVRYINNEGIRGIAMVIFLSCLIAVYQDGVPQFFVKLSDHLFLKISGVLITVSLFYATANYWAKDSSLSKMMRFVGRRTFDVYLIHYTFLPDLSWAHPFLSGERSFLLELVFAATVSIIILSLSVLSGSVLRSSWVTSSSLLGVLKK